VIESEWEVCSAGTRGVPDWSEAKGGYAAKARHVAPGGSYDRAMERLSDLSGTAPATATTTSEHIGWFRAYRTPC